MWPGSTDDRKRNLTQAHSLKHLKVRFKKRGDLQTLATKYPRALVMHFLAQARLMAGMAPATTNGVLVQTMLGQAAV